MASANQLPPLVVICGPTASGKTELALRLAELHGVEVVSADSRQVYRGMDIGTAKPNHVERARVPHHLLDVVDPDQDFSAVDFVRQGTLAVSAIHRRGRLPLLVGGTGLYIRTLIGGVVDAPGEDRELRQQLLAEEERCGEGTLHRRLQAVDPVSAARLAPRDRVRIVRALEVFHLGGRPLSALQAEHGFANCPYRLLRLGMAVERDELYRRIDRRAEQMLADGLLDEVRGLLARGYDPQLKSLGTIGYRELIRHLQGDLPLAEAVALIQRETRRYAKRQMTWFQREAEIIWVDSSRDFARIAKLIDTFCAAR